MGGGAPCVPHPGNNWCGKGNPVKAVVDTAKDVVGDVKLPSAKDVQATISSGGLNLVPGAMKELQNMNAFSKLAGAAGVDGTLGKVAEGADALFGMDPKRQLDFIKGLFPKAPSQEELTAALKDPTIIEDLAEKKAAREDLLAGFQGMEKRLGENLLQGAEFAGRAIDKELSGLIGQYEDLAGISKQAIGAQQFASGMGRSGLTMSRLEGADLSKLQSVSSARKAAEEKKRSVGENVRAARQATIDRRREIQNRMLDLEIQGLESARFEQEVGQARADFSAFVNNLEMSAQSKADMAGMLGGIAGLGAMGAGYAMSKPSSTPTGGTNTMSPQAGSYNASTEMA